MLLLRQRKFYAETTTNNTGRGKKKVEKGSVALKSQYRLLGEKANEEKK